MEQGGTPAVATPRYHPRSVDFIDELPCDPSGKLYKRLLRDRYWEGHRTRIAGD